MSEAAYFACPVCKQGMRLGAFEKCPSCGTPLSKAGQVVETKNQETEGEEEGE